MEIRQANKKDSAALTALYHILSSEYQDNPEAILAALDHPSTIIFVAEDERGVIGTATISFRAVPSKGLVGYVDDVVVAPANQGLGLGRKLSEHCLQEAWDRGAVRIELTSSPDRQAANNLYKKLGFKQRETNAHYLDI